MNSDKIDFCIVFFQFKQLMLQLDPDDMDEEGESKVGSALNTTVGCSMSVSSTTMPVLNESDQIELANYKVGITRPES